jgi:hypothetical protein
MSTHANIKTRVYKFLSDNPEVKKVDVVSHFLKEGCHRSTLYRYIKLYEAGTQVERKKGTGRPRVFSTKANVKKIEKMFNNRDGISLRKAASKLKCHHQTVKNILKQHTNIKCYKKRKIPKRTEAQKKAARPKCKKIFERFKSYDFILDDESYFTLSHTTQSGNDRFYSSDREKTPNNVKYSEKSKFESKVLVWLAISNRGVSKLFMVPSGLAINQHVYLKECIIKRLVPFIKKHHQNGDYVFWPDLASSHYAKSVTNWMDKKNVKYVPKLINPANLPEARPIEDFWAYLKTLVYQNNWQAKNIKQLRRRIKWAYSKMDKSFVQRLAADTKRRLEKIRRNGL